MASRFWCFEITVEIKFFIALEPNITERKRREQFRDEFISMIGHQLKNPVTALRWTLDMLSRTGGLNAKQRDALETLYRETGGLRDLIGDLLVLARIENVEFKKEPIDLADEVEGIIEAMRRQYPGRTFLFEKNADTFPLIASRTLVSQVLTNIIGNAADYTDRASGRVEIRLKTESNVYVFSCKDNGIGIPPEDQPRIFSRFFRASNAAEKKSAGSGLGLFIVKMICDDLGWGVRLTSIPGKGTEITLTIPI
ncbi:MAG: HAMP domain-containing sensor histidine kinase [Patescibacteria group bacterium]